MTTTTRPVSQTRSFSTVFLIEMWERFGYYGMQALIVLYMVERLGFADHRAVLTWGAAAALIYVAPAFGGWIGDKILGTRRTMLSGAMVLALGYALMTVPGQSVTFLFIALGVIVVGNGLFKANAGNLVRKIYEGDESKIDSAFTIYYMAVNIGSMISMLLTPFIKDYVNDVYGHGFGWHAAFAVCCVGLLVGLSNYAVMRHTLKHIGSPPDAHRVNLRKLAVVLACCVVAVFVSAVVLRYEIVARIFVYVAGATVLGIFVYLIAKSEQSERAGMAAALVLVVQTVLFFIFYQQMGTSLTLFAKRNVDTTFNLFGLDLFNWIPAQFQSLNPIWIFILSPILAFLYNRASKGRGDLPVAVKFVLGFVVVAIAFFLYSTAGHFVSEPGKTSQWVLVWGYGFQSLGELLISGLGLAFIARYVPARMGGFMMGAYFVSTGVSQYLGGLVSGLASVPSTIKDIVVHAGTPLVARVQTVYPAVMSMSIEDFRKWLGGGKNAVHIAADHHLPAFASLPQSTQALLQHFNQALFPMTLPTYTTLFFWLGVGAIGCIIVSIACLPLMKRLDAQHHAHPGSTDTPLPTIGSEE